MKRRAPKHAEPFTAVPERPRRLLKPHRTAYAVYTELLARCGPTASVRVRQTTIAASLGVHPNTIGTAIALLKSTGLVEVRQTRGTAYYWLPDHPAYASDLAEYEERKTANAIRRGETPHMKPLLTVVPETHLNTPTTTVGCELETTVDCGFISKDVLTSRDLDAPRRSASLLGIVGWPGSEETRPAPDWSTEPAKEPSQPTMTIEEWAGQPPTAQFAAERPGGWL